MRRAPRPNEALFTVGSCVACSSIIALLVVVIVMQPDCMNASAWWLLLPVGLFVAGSVMIVVDMDRYDQWRLKDVDAPAHQRRVKDRHYLIRRPFLIDDAPAELPGPEVILHPGDVHRGHTSSGEYEGEPL